MSINKLNISPTESYQLTELALVDESDYNGTVINNVSFEITPPSFSKRNVPFTPKEINIFTTQDLIPGCDEDTVLPDGIYKIKYTVNYTTVIEKQFIRVANTQFKLQTLVLSILSGSCNDQETYRKAKVLLEGAVAASNRCQNELSQEMLRQANKLISKSCNC